MKADREISFKLDKLAVEIDKLITKYHEDVGGGQLEIELLYREDQSGKIKYMSSDFIHMTN